jgi:tRNA-2-methylthio-N6-dimethylallyladenosine synthase
LEKLVEHVHLPLQSGSNRMLKKMRRGYTSETYLRLVDDLRRARPGIAITTDIIVGFPGETDEDYQLTRAMVDRIGFDNAFVFRYSQRRDTPAASMHDQVAEETKESWNQDLLSVVNRHSREKLNAHIGRRVEILCEGRSKNNPSRLTGRTRTNKIVVFEGSPRHVGEIFDVRIGSASASTLYGDPALIAS